MGGKRVIPERKGNDMLSFINHTLIGRSVEWRDDLWIVTGARRDQDSDSSVSFRLSPLNANLPREEVWTEFTPTFGARSTFSVSENMATLPPPTFLKDKE